VGDIVDRLENGVGEMLAIRNFGQKSLEELLARMEEKGYLPDDLDLS
jgi:DNA-directed RNA polymerase subunit alpha